jgi:hypothetical protein
MMDNIMFKNQSVNDWENKPKRCVVNANASEKHIITQARKVSRSPALMEAEGKFKI